MLLKVLPIKSLVSDPITHALADSSPIIAYQQTSTIFGLGCFAGVNFCKFLTYSLEFTVQTQRELSRFSSWFSTTPPKREKKAKNSNRRRPEVCKSNGSSRNPRRGCEKLPREPGRSPFYEKVYSNVACGRATSTIP